MKVNIRKIILSLICCTVIISCKPSFEKKDSGLEYRFIEQNEKAPKARWGDILQVKMMYKTSNDSVLFNSDAISDSFRIILKKPNWKGALEEGLVMMHIGDSAEFKVDAQLFYDKTLKKVRPDFIPIGSVITFFVRLEKITLLADYEKELTKAKKKLGDEETEKINAYVVANNITVPKLISGAYYIETLKGKGRQANSGNVVEIRYTGKFLDGKVFDSNINKPKPWSFKIGSDEAIDGISEALQRMHVGGKATAIIPSTSAYGERGYGPVPPYTPLVFDIELVKVIR
jgi:FKBP-type peptidyl-prolyl cis-trans isomerase FkpA